MVWDMLGIRSGVMSPVAEATWDMLGIRSGVISPAAPPPVAKWDMLAVRSGILAPYVPPPPVGTATIAVSSTPTGATVLINSAIVGNTPVSYKIQPGTYTVLVKMTGYNNFTTNVTVAANQTKTVNAVLVKAALEPKATNWLPYVAIGGGAILIVAAVAASSKRRK